MSMSGTDKRRLALGSGSIVMAPPNVGWTAGVRGGLGKSELASQLNPRVKQLPYKSSSTATDVSLIVSVSKRPVKGDFLLAYLP